MKQCTVLAFIVLCLFSACTKSAAPVDPVDEAAIAAVKAAKNSRELKSAYALLQPAEKLEIWNRHVDYFIQTHDLTSEQLAFVTDFKDQWLVKDVFEKNSPVLANFSAALPQIKNKAQALLGVPDAFALLIDLPSDKGYYGYSIATTRVETNSVKTDSPNDCHCSRTDPYCSEGRCADTGCNTSSFGCGTLFAFSCNGVCSLI